jgi:hypothetical protein
VPSPDILKKINTFLYGLLKVDIYQGSDREYLMRQTNVTVTGWEKYRVEMQVHFDDQVDVYGSQKYNYLMITI